MGIDELIESAVAERIMMLLKRSHDKEGRARHDAVMEIFAGLEPEKRAVVESYLDSITDREAEDEWKLYTGGLKDGIALAMWMLGTMEEYRKQFGDERNP